VRRTSFDPQVHGFAFANSWKLEGAERQHIYGDFIAYFVQRRLLGPLGAWLAPFVVRSLRGQLERHLTPQYGLCGGMCFAALDFYVREGAPPFPRGQHASDNPAPGTPLRRYIWKRQLDSLVSDGARFLIWLVILNYVPSGWPFRGGPRWLLARSKREWGKLKASVDEGRPVLIGLVRATGNVYENHQVLAIGYEEADEANGAIILYDPNCPDRASIISIRFGAQQLDGQESCSADAPLRGFFCETYSPSEPAEALE
jgi:hypothetical protein